VTGPTASESGWADQADPADENGGADEEGHAGEDAELDAGPIYVWNPSANTETFPSVPRVPRGDA
jgi:hypothetical protein